MSLQHFSTLEYSSFYEGPTCTFGGLGGRLGHEWCSFHLPFDVIRLIPSNRISFGSSPAPLAINIKYALFVTRRLSTEVVHSLTI